MIIRHRFAGNEGLIFGYALAFLVGALANSAHGQSLVGSAKAAPFQLFAPKVASRSDDRFLYVESNGMPSHPMMIGITAWQQQVPLPQRYVGANAWQIPLNPTPAASPRTIKNQFLRGAIALAVNGIPIFNPQNNRGEVSAGVGVKGICQAFAPT